MDILTSNQKAWIVAGLSVVCLVMYVYKLRKRTFKRQADRKRPNSYQRRIFRQAKALIASKNFVGAAQLLESIERQREAISLLENNGLIKEACNMLLRMHLPHRAAMIYQRHGAWKNAADCFELARQPAEVARCAREYGDFTRAAKNYQVAGMAEEAANCLFATGDLRAAALLCAFHHLEERAIEIYNKFAEQTPNIKLIEFSEEELGFIRRYLAMGLLDKRFADSLARGNKILDVVTEFIQKGKTQEAADVYLRATADLGPHLIALTHLTDEQSAILADMFWVAANYEYSGMVYERMKEFAKAGEAFAECEDFGRAAYCYERAGMHAAAAQMHAKHGGASNAYRKRPEPASAAERANPFVLMETNASRTLTKPVDDAEVFENENTVVMGKEEFVMPQDLVQPVASENRLSFHRAQFIEDLDYQQKNQIWEIGTVKRFPRGATILDMNDEPPGVYFILAGRVGVIKQNQLKPEVMMPPATFGEFWLLVDHPSQVRFVAESDCELLLVERAAFTDLLDKNGTIARKLYKRFTKRLLDRFLTPRNSLPGRSAS